MLRLSTFVSVALGLGLALAVPARAAPPYGADGGGRNNPAFSEPGARPPPKPFLRPASTKASGGWTQTPDGRRFWTDGNSSVSVGGYVRYDAAVGHEPR
ncbi:MAG: hypothetical protein GX458_22775 [Phyllobacteriaceae bacterium]|nr:hypothetical protein [Phyllobacteriaceae bacterium]